MVDQPRTFSIGEALDCAVGMAEQGNHEGSIGMCRGILVHEPDNTKAMNHLGAALFALKQYEQAFYWFWRHLELCPRAADALTNYGLCLGQLGHLEQSLSYLSRAIHQANKRDAQYPPTAMAMFYNNLGNTLEKLERYEDALRALDTALTHCPNDGFSLYTRGVVLLRLNRQEDAIASFNAALAIDQDDVDARYNRGMALLRLGRLKEGFEDYEARLLTTENKVLNLGLPADKKWNGQPLNGKTLLIHGEQGLGDDIQFMRFVGGVERFHPAKTMLIVHAATKPLMVDLGVTLLNTGEPLPDYDYWVALMSLPHMLGYEEKPVIMPYPLADTVIDSKRVASWRDRIAKVIPETGRLRVGVCWAGNFMHKNDKHRSIPLEKFATLFDTPGCDFLSFQQMRPEDLETFAQLQQKHPNLKACWFKDLRDTGAAILNCDLIVTVDTAIAHLAGSLMRRTFLLLPAMNCDWRWQTECRDTPWYPSMTLYRQPKVGEWLPALHDVRRTLLAWRNSIAA